MIFPISKKQVAAILAEMPNVKVTRFEENGVLVGWDFHCETGDVLRANPEDYWPPTIPMSMRLAKEITSSYEYRIQVGRGKSAYKNKYSGLTESQAALYYAGINIGNGYKKRLQESVNGGPWKTLLRARS